MFSGKNALSNVLLLVIIIIIAVFVIIGMVSVVAPGVSSNKRIEPKIKLIIKNNQVDTIFIYNK